MCTKEQLARMRSTKEQRWSISEGLSTRPKARHKKPKAERTTKRELSIKPKARRTTKRELSIRSKARRTAKRELSTRSKARRTRSKAERTRSKAERTRTRAAKELAGATTSTATGEQGGIRRRPKATWHQRRVSWHQQGTF